MPRLLPVSLALVCAALAACQTPFYVDDPPPRFNTYNTNPNRTEPTPVPAYDSPVQPQPLPPAANYPQSDRPIASDVIPDSNPSPRTVPRSEAPRVSPPPAPPRELLTGTPVAGKPGFVTSPYAPRAGYVDTRGFSPGEQVKCPYSGKIFLVP